MHLRESQLLHPKKKSCSCAQHFSEILADDARHSNCVVRFFIVRLCGSVVCIDRNLRKKTTGRSDRFYSAQFFQLSKNLLKKKSCNWPGPRLGPLAVRLIAPTSRRGAGSAPVCAATLPLVGRVPAPLLLSGHWLSRQRPLPPACCVPVTAALAPIRELSSGQCDCCLSAVPYTKSSKCCHSADNVI